MQDISCWLVNHASSRGVVEALTLIVLAWQCGWRSLCHRMLWGAAPAYCVVCWVERAVNKGVRPLTATAGMTIFASHLFTVTIILVAANLQWGRISRKGGCVCVSRRANHRPGGRVRKPSKDWSVRIVGTVGCSIVILEAEHTAGNGSPSPREGLIV